MQWKKLEPTDSFKNGQCVLIATKGLNSRIHYARFYQGEAGTHFNWPPGKSNLDQILYWAEVADPPQEWFTQHLAAHARWNEAIDERVRMEQSG